MIYLSNLDIRIVLGITSSTCWGQARGGWWWLAPTCSHPAPGNGHLGTASSLETQTTMFIRCPAQCEAGSSVGKWAIITISWDPLSWGQFCGLLSMSYKWIQLVGSYLNATICDMHFSSFLTNHTQNGRINFLFSVSLDGRFQTLFLPGPWVLTFDNLWIVHTES